LKSQARDEQLLTIKNSLVFKEFGYMGLVRDLSTRWGGLSWVFDPF